MLACSQTARFFKIRYLHLHMTDDHAWSFPSAAFPQLGSENVGFRGRAPAGERGADARGHFRRALARVLRLRTCPVLARTCLALLCTVVVLSTH